MLIGPRAHERPQEFKPEDVRLNDGSPLYYIFLDHPTSLRLRPSEVEDAKNDLAYFIEKVPNKVLQCQGLSLEKAKQLLVGQKKSREEGEESQFRAAA